MKLELHGSIIAIIAILTIVCPERGRAQVPAVPTTPAATSGVSLTWTASTGTDAAVGYNIYRSGVYVGNTSGTSYLDETAQMGDYYTYAVAAVDSAGNVSAPSATVGARTPGGTDTTIWSGTASGADANDSSAVEVGVKFTSSQMGGITGIRFYKASANTGTHIGQLYSLSGGLLATGTFTNETPGGWQELDFATPAMISPGGTYVAAYYAPSGHYAATGTYFATDPVISGSLTALSGSNGVYSYSGTGPVFPASSYHSTNYWVDTVFQPPVSLWAGTTGPTGSGTDAGDSHATNLGMQFVPAVSGLVTGVQFYKGGSNTGTHIGQLWSSSGGNLATGTFTNETASGWQQLTFATPVAVTAGGTYVASYYAPNGHYAASGTYFATEAYSNPPLTALSGSNGVYIYSGSAAFPTSSYESTNYWVDVLFVP